MTALGAKNSGKEESAPIEELITVLNTWADFGEKPLCIGNKPLIERLQGHPNISPKVVFYELCRSEGQ